MDFYILISLIAGFVYLLIFYDSFIKAKKFNILIYFSFLSFAMFLITLLNLHLSISKTNQEFHLIIFNFAFAIFPFVIYSFIKNFFNVFQKGSIFNLIINIILILNAIFIAIYTISIFMFNLPYSFKNILLMFSPQIVILLMSILILIYKKKKVTNKFYFYYITAGLISSLIIFIFYYYIIPDSLFKKYYIVHILSLLWFAPLWFYVIRTEFFRYNLPINDMNFFEFIYDIMFYTNMDGSIIEINDYGKRILADYIYSNINKYFNEDVLSNLKTIKNTNNVFNTTTELRINDNTTIPVELKVMNYFDKISGFNGLLFICKDLRNEIKLKKEETLRGVIEKEKAHYKESLEFLEKTAKTLNEFSNEDEIFDFILDSLAEMYRNSYFFIAKYDFNNEELYIYKFRNFKDLDINLLKRYNINLYNFRVKYNKDKIVAYTKDHSEFFRFKDFEELSFGKINNSIGDIIIRLLNISDVYGFTFSIDNMFYAGVGLCLTNNEVEFDKEKVICFLRYSFIALDRIKKNYSIITNINISNKLNIISEVFNSSLEYKEKIKKSLEIFSSFFESNFICLYSNRLINSSVKAILNEYYIKPNYNIDIVNEFAYDEVFKKYRYEFLNTNYILNISNNDFENKDILHYFHTENLIVFPYKVENCWAGIICMDYNKNINVNSESFINLIINYKYKIELFFAIENNSTLISEHNALYCKITELSPLPIIVCDKNLIIKNYNKNFSQIFLISNHIKDRMNLINYVSDKHKDILIEMLSKLDFNSDFQKKLELYLLNKDNEEIYCELFISNFKMNREDNLIIIINDLTLKQIETDELLKTAISEEIKNKIKNNFLSNLTHELRTPLNSINGMTDLLYEVVKDSKGLICLNHLKESAIRMQNIINSIIDFLKTDNKDIKLIESKFYINEIIYKVLSEFSFELKNKDLKVNIDIKKNVPEILIGDHEKLEKILKNIIDNSIKFTNQGLIDISIKKGSILDDSGYIYLHFIISDTGVGIPKERLEKIFSDFLPVEDVYSKKSRGIGLGLIITKKLVEILNGSIWIDSVEGKGSKVNIILPFKKYEERSYEENQKDIDKINVLILEKNELNRSILSDTIKKNNVEILYIENIKEISSIINDKRIDILFINIDDNKTEYLNEILKLKHNDNDKIEELYIVAITNEKEIEINELGNYGIDNYLVMPVSSNELSNVMMDYLKRKNLSFNYKKLMNKIDNSLEVFKRLVEIFLKDYQERIDTFSDVIKKRDFQQIQTIAHRFKGSLLNLEAKVAGDIAYTIEKLGREKKDDNLDELYKIFLEKLEILKNDLKKTAHID